MAQSDQVWRDVRCLRDESVAQECKRELVECLGERKDFDDPENLWTDFKTKVLKLKESCVTSPPILRISELTLRPKS